LPGRFRFFDQQGFHVGEDKAGIEARIEDRGLRMGQAHEDYFISLASSSSNVFTSAKTSRESKVPEL
jgi:hypothetical protein